MAEITCRNCKSILKYGNADLRQYYPEVGNPFYGTLAFDEMYSFYCPVCGVIVEAPKVRTNKERENE